MLHWDPLCESSSLNSAQFMQITERMLISESKLLLSVRSNAYSTYLTILNLQTWWHSQILCGLSNIVSCSYSFSLVFWISWSVVRFEFSGRDGVEHRPATETRRSTPPSPPPATATVITSAPPLASTSPQPRSLHRRRWLSGVSSIATISAGWWDA